MSDSFEPIPTPERDDYDRLLEDVEDWANLYKAPKTESKIGKVGRFAIKCLEEFGNASQGLSSLGAPHREDFPEA